MVDLGNGLPGEVERDPDGEDEEEGVEEPALVGRHVLIAGLEVVLRGGRIHARGTFPASDEFPRRGRGPPPQRRTPYLPNTLEGHGDGNSRRAATPSVVGPGNANGPRCSSGGIPRGEPGTAATAHAGAYAATAWRAPDGIKIALSLSGNRPGRITIRSKAAARASRFVASDSSPASHAFRRPPFRASI